MLTRKEQFSSLTLFMKPPKEPISINDFRTLAVERQKMLREVDNLLMRGVSDKKYEDDLRNIIYKYMRINDKITEIKDIKSHNILKLAYCYKDEMRKWFMHKELAIFEQRYKDSSSDEQHRFLSQISLNYPTENITENKLLTELINIYKYPDEQKSNTNVFIIPFTHLPELVSSRKCYIKDGFIYLPVFHIFDILRFHVKTELSKSMAETLQLYRRLTDQRILDIVNNLSTVYLGQDYAHIPASISNITPDDIHPLSRVHFPLCMRIIEDHLMKNHHLKYNGRLQYTLFLKGIGLKMEDSIAYFKKNYANTNDRKFREYEYGIRFNYGKEGKRTNYTPYSCIKIINMGSPTINECHGCPYKYLSQDRLRSYCIENKMGTGDIEDIIETAREHNYQFACQKFYEKTHPNCEALMVTHPNLYFDTSYNYSKNKK